MPRGRELFPARESEAHAGGRGRGVSGVGDNSAGFDGAEVGRALGGGDGLNGLPREDLRGGRDGPSALPHVLLLPSLYVFRDLRREPALEIFVGEQGALDDALGDAAG